MIARNEYGYRIGATHHNSTIPDSIVIQIRDLHEQAGMTYVQIAEHLHLSVSTVRKIGKYERRQFPRPEMPS